VVHVRQTDPLQLQLHAHADAVRLLRERIGLWLDENGASTKDAFEVLLATAEAFSNAVEHPTESRSGLVDINGTITEDVLTISIRDYGHWQSDTTQKEDGGLGLVLMSIVMDAVEFGRGADGTTVTMRRRLGLSAQSS
jgi:anti-sigma regulatory factor (Ser/Thr protein kinase)